MNRPPKLLCGVLLALCDLKETKGSSFNQISKYVESRSKKLPITARALPLEIQKALKYGTKNKLLSAHRGKFCMNSSLINPLKMFAKKQQKASENDGKNSDMPIQEGKRRRRRSLKSRRTKRRRVGRKRSLSLANKDGDNQDEIEVYEARRRRRKASKRSRKGRNRKSGTRARPNLIDFQPNLEFGN